MITASPLDQAERHFESADGLTRAAAVVARDRDIVRRCLRDGRRRKAGTQTRAALHQLTGYYRHGNPR